MTFDLKVKIAGTLAICTPILMGAFIANGLPFIPWFFVAFSPLFLAVLFIIWWPHDQP